jgi:hypothetical protein
MSAVDRTVPARGEAIADPYRHNLSFQTNYAASLPLNAAALNHVQCASNLIKDENSSRSAFWNNVYDHGARGRGCVYQERDPDTRPPAGLPL